MKKYLEIYVGSRGCIEGVEIKIYKDIKKVLEIESKENCKEIEEDEEMDEEYKEEVLDYYSWGVDLDGNYFLGLGDEEVKIYVDLESNKFIEWREKNNIDLEKDVNKIEDVVIKELIN